MKSLDDASFVASIRSSLGEEVAGRLFNALRTEPSTSIRLNPSKLRSSPFGGTPVPWSPFAYLLDKRPSFTMDPLFHAGCYYVQDSSAMFVGEVLRNVLESSGRDLRVLDLCAAPGGKTTDIASSLRHVYGDDFRLVANEVMRQRCGVLNENVAIWGDKNISVTNCDPKAFARLEEYFDIIVADVPCSGEGMMRKDAQAVADWSLETVQLCAARQRRIIADVWQALKPGGVLVYSTCTFEDAENDSNLEWICEELGASFLDSDLTFEGVIKTAHGYLLVPGFVPGEGQWVGAVRKGGSAGSSKRKEDKAIQSLRPLETPFTDDSYPHFELDRAQALHYLHGDALALADAPRGMLVMCYEGHTLGLAKNIGTRCNNLYPKSRRILKQIEI